MAQQVPLSDRLAAEFRHFHSCRRRTTRSWSSTPRARRSGSRFAAATDREILSFSTARSFTTLDVPLRARFGTSSALCCWTLARDSTAEDASAFADLTLGVRWLDTALVFSGEARWRSRWGESDGVRSSFNDHSPTLDFSFKTNRGAGRRIRWSQEVQFSSPSADLCNLSTEKVEKALKSASKSNTAKFCICE